jgi:hypothetical protein
LDLLVLSYQVFEKALVAATLHDEVQMEVVAKVLHV